MEDESVSVTSPLANEKGNKRRILDSNGNYVSLVYVDSSSKADTAHTPKGKNADCGEWNPMLFKTEDEDKHKIECNSQKTSFDDLGQQANNSNDCAIWVITWMEKMKADVYKIDVDDGTRLRVLKFDNEFLQQAE
ncbi:uncharacterized protein LOC123882869 isoform X2 [Trifolium pratense]|uniref:uncharacterized protein LOC123882869 isoform X2 n=1 Tax=Trifolium pratense TaxID=57577 RepID=UPI001E696C37|nr:uncharacterized protein LOC123882869 isoform X2 [Trifolium pratense]